MLCVALVVLAVQWTPLATVLSIEDPGRDGCVLAFAMSLVPFFAGQVRLGVQRWRLAARPPDVASEPAARQPAPP